MKKIDEPIIVEQTFDVEIETVWRSITELDLMRQWFFENIPSFKPEVGFETKFNILSGGRDFLHLWKITEVIPLKRISYDWKFEGYPGKSTSIFELSELNKSTTLRLTMLVRESFPEDIPEFIRENGLIGWNYFIKERLKELLGK